MRPIYKMKIYLDPQEVELLRLLLSREFGKSELLPRVVVPDPLRVAERLLPRLDRGDS